MGENFSFKLTKLGIYVASMKVLGSQKINDFDAVYATLKALIYLARLENPLFPFKFLITVRILAGEVTRKGENRDKRNI